MTTARNIISLVESILSERSIPSLPAEELIRILDRKLHQDLDSEFLFSEVKFPIHDAGERIHIGNSLFFTYDNIEIATPEMNIMYKEILKEKYLKQEFIKKYGWYIAGEEDMRDSAFIHLTPQLKAGEDTNVILEPLHGSRNPDVPEFIYHITLKKNIPSIEKNGIIPGHGIHNQYGRNFRPDRIYVLFSKKGIKNFRDDLWYSVQDKGIKKSDYVLVTIDTSKLRKGTKFYTDPELSLMEHPSHFTNTHIPAEACTIGKI